ncbi:MAG: hypothetical protein ACYDCO_27145 [Armatimonadota bacterium]
MAAKRFEDLVSGGNEVNGLAGPAAAQRLEDLFDAVQTEFELRWSLAYGHLTVPTLAIDGTHVTCTAFDGILDGKHVGGAGFWDLTGKAAGTYHLEKTNADAFASPSTSQNSAQLHEGTVTVDGAGNLSLLTPDATQGINFRGATAQLSQWVPRGTWTTSFAYRGNSTYRDVVTYAGSCYVAKSDHTSGASTEPGVGGSWGTYWQLLASKGATGSPGPAGGLTVPKGDWQAGIAYDASNPDTVVGSDGHGYQCILDHTSTADDEPGVGVNQATYWTRYVNAGTTGATGAAGAGFTPQGAWLTGTAYAITPDIDWVTHNGNSYACILAHTSGATTEPGVGVDWATYWQQLSEKGAPGNPMNWRDAWVTGTAYVAGDGVNRLGSSFYCKLDHTAGAANEPGVGASWTTYWSYIAQKGTDGAAGRTVLSGSGAPAGGTGTNGDFYIDTTAWQIYGPKAAGAWGAGTNIVGTGVDGADGKGFNLRGAWLTATAYATATDYDVVTNNGSAYACIVGHTSGTDSDEPGVGANWGTYWQLLVVSAGGISIVTTVGDPGSDGNIPSEQAVREAIAAIPAGSDGTPSPNLLDNPEFAIDQRGGGASRASGGDDVYGHDRWVFLTKGTPPTIETIDSGLHTASKALRLTQNGAQPQSGVLQIVESRKSLPYRGRAMKLQARVRYAAATTIYWALLEWTGTADSVTSDVVNDWTSASKTAGGFFLGANLAVVATGTQAVLANTWTAMSGAGTPSTSCNNLILFLWAEEAVSPGAMDITECDLFAGSSTRTWTPKDPAADEMECMRHCYVFQSPFHSGFRYGTKYVGGFYLHHPVPMRITPPSVAHNISGWSGTWAPGTTLAGFYNSTADAAVTITGALTVTLSARDRFETQMSFTAGTSFSGTSGDIGIVGFGPDVRAIISADL